MAAGDSDDGSEGYPQAVLVGPVNSGKTALATSLRQAIAAPRLGYEGMSAVVGSEGETEKLFNSAAGSAATGTITQATTDEEFPIRFTLSPTWSTAGENHVIPPYAFVVADAGGGLLLREAEDSAGTTDEIRNAANDFRDAIANAESVILCVPQTSEGYLEALDYGFDEVLAALARTDNKNLERLIIAVTKYDSRFVDLKPYGTTGATALAMARIRDEEKRPPGPHDALRIASDRNVMVETASRIVADTPKLLDVLRNVERVIAKRRERAARENGEDEVEAAHTGYPENASVWIAMTSVFGFVYGEGIVNSFRDKAGNWVLKASGGPGPSLAGDGSTPFTFDPHGSHSDGRRAPARRTLGLWRPFGVLEAFLVAMNVRPQSQEALERSNLVPLYAVEEYLEDPEAYLHGHSRASRRE